MSLRHLKRLEEEKRLNKSPDETDGDRIELSGDRFEVERPKKSAFQLLADASDSDENEKQEQKSSLEDLVESSRGLSVRKKNKRKKGKNKNKQDATILDDVEKQLGFIQGSSSATEQPISKEQEFHEALNIQMKFFMAENELKKKFGAAALREDRQTEKRVGQKRLGVKSIFLSEPGKHYQALQGSKIGGISMKTTDIIDVFEFQYSTDYWISQGEFMLYVQAMSHEGLYELLIRYGDHLDLLIQLAEMSTMQGEKREAAEYIERALFVLEKTFHSSFNIREGKCRLDYRCKTNRPLFIVLFLHMCNLGEQGCPRTALEIAKLILTLDPDYDPLAILLVIDHYALRSQQYAWLSDFYDVCQKAGKNLDQISSFKYSIALSRFHLKQFSEADGLLEEALLSFPEVFKGIIDKNSIMLDSKTAKIFDNIYPEDVTVKLYVERCAWMYREPGVLRWLERVATSLVDSGAKPRKVKSPSRPLVNVLRHVSLSHVHGVSASSQDVNSRNSGNFSFDPFPPKKSYGDKTPALPSLAAEELLPEETLANLINSVNPAWSADNNDNPRAQLGATVQELMRNLMDVFEVARGRGVGDNGADQNRPPQNHND